jgi:hypothetical protein
MPAMQHAVNTIFGNAFLGTWTSPAKAAWIGTFGAAGPVPKSSNTGITTYDFTSLPNGVLPAGSYDGVLGFDLTATNASGALVTPWLDTPIAAWGAGNGLGGTPAAFDMPQWAYGAGIYHLDGYSVSSIPTNPSITFALTNNTPITTLTLNKGFISYSFSLAAPVPESATAGMLGIGLYGLVGFGLRRSQGRAHLVARTKMEVPTHRDADIHDGDVIPNHRQRDAKWTIETCRAEAFAPLYSTSFPYHELNPFSVGAMIRQ